MPVPSAITDLSQTAGSNSPTGSESPITADDYFRTYASFIALLRDGKGFTDMVTLASGSTTDIGGQNAMAVEITGTTTITNFGTTYNGPRFLRFTGALRLTHNATSLYLPGAANIKTVSGDTCIAVPNSSANGWVVIAYQRTPSRGSVTMHATTMDLWAEPKIVDGTGSAVTITDIADAPQAGAVRILYPVANTVITDGATFDVDGGANYTTKAGDALIFEAVTTTTFKVHIVKADGTAVVADKSTQIQPISASVAANALTISASALSLDFRSTTLGSGTVTRVTGTPSNLVISSGSTLGTTNGVQSDIAVLAINNAGTIELAAVNMAGGVDLSETGLISTTAEGGAGAADSATTIYSTTARTNVAYRVIGIVRSTQATAGTWATAPSLIQGNGGNTQIKTALNATGSPPMFACRAWATFSGTATGTNAPANGGNVTSVTRNGAGDYTINFTTAMPNTNYCATFGYVPDSLSATFNAKVLYVVNRNTTDLRIYTLGAGSGGALLDFTTIHVSIFA